MATDIEESDTDDHERPAPPKRQCTRLVKVNETIWDMERGLSKNEETVQDTENVEYDDAEKHAREKLKRWQDCQMAKGYVDNAMNRILEVCITKRLEESRFQLLRGNDMEDTAVMMAIHNHGLVQSVGRVSQSDTFYSDKASGYWTNNEYDDMHCSCPSNYIQVEDSVATTSMDSLKFNDTKDIVYNGFDWDLDKIDENDQQENILERAVAEAIKKKGLSVLSVDHG